ncbi:UNKNOWN [Stylonychia lemnae]|uniref:Uncharacterized protein n=1 Tax=Stylonychia lemnae TaxID=5949 RepID=A0A078ASQ3_STYLE|nr:UNKNOWN [Stylonychia lemnae]|eukprot:CDW85209.1 UNKNOWN [Stylonychia lemnae]
MNQKQLQLSNWKFRGLPESESYVKPTSEKDDVVLPKSQPAWANFLIGIFTAVIVLLVLIALDGNNAQSEINDPQFGQNVGIRLNANQNFQNAIIKFEQNRNEEAKALNEEEQDMVYEYANTHTRTPSVTRDDRLNKLEQQLKQHQIQNKLMKNERKSMFLDHAMQSETKLSSEDSPLKKNQHKSKLEQPSIKMNNFFNDPEIATRSLQNKRRSELPKLKLRQF